MQLLRRVKQKWVLWFLVAVYLVLSFWSWRSFHPHQEVPLVVHNTKNDEGRPQKTIIVAGIKPDDASSSSTRTTANNVQNNNPLEDLSSVDYWACCGLGHRLIRMSLAHYVAKQRNFSLRAFWGWCGEQQPIEVFSYLFRPYLASELPNVNGMHGPSSSRQNPLLLPFYNEVPGFAALVRRKPTTNNTTTTNSDECPCQPDKIASDLELYSSLRERFRHKTRVDSFVQEHFANATVIGIHVRAGNGESGDFKRKGRTIDNPREWVGHVCKHIQDLVATQQQKQQTQQLPKQPPVVLYIATDTPSMITLFRNALAPTGMKVLDLPQERKEEGQGVLFGEADKVHNKGDDEEEHDNDYSSCLRGWTDTLTDMFLLSHADVVIAGKPSSFSQTLPMSLAFGNEARAFPDAAYCEVIPHFEETARHVGIPNGTTTTTTTTEWEEVAPKLQCYQSYTDWCCNYSTWIQLRYKGPNGHTKIHSKEFVRFPPPGQAAGTLKDYPGMRNRTHGCLRPRRGRAGGGQKDKCLPHEW